MASYGTLLALAPLLIALSSASPDSANLQRNIIFNPDDLPPGDVKVPNFYHLRYSISKDSQTVNDAILKSRQAGIFSLYTAKFQAHTRPDFFQGEEEFFGREGRVVARGI